MQYIIKDGKIVPAEMMEAARFFGDINNRTVDRTQFPDGSYVSTVFLGIDHSFGRGPPILFETMIFGNAKFEDHQWRYCTCEEAQVGHKKIIACIEAGIDPYTQNINNEESVEEFFNMYTGEDN